MELLKARDNLTHQIGDVTFTIRATASVRDKLDMDLCGEYQEGRFQITRRDLFLKIIELFVVDWSGVTEDGKPVPYSYETFMTRLPYDAATDWLLKLGAFIWEHLGLTPAQESGGDSVKNG